jgi:hypothetical protein
MQGDDRQFVIFDQPRFDAGFGGGDFLDVDGVGRQRTEDGEQKTEEEKTFAARAT